MKKKKYRKITNENTSKYFVPKFIEEKQAVKFINNIKSNKATADLYVLYFLPIQINIIHFSTFQYTAQTLKTKKKKKNLRK